MARGGSASAGLSGAFAAAAAAGAYFGARNLSATADWRASVTASALADNNAKASAAATGANICWVATGVLGAAGLSLLFFTRF